MGSIWSPGFDVPTLLLEPIRPHLDGERLGFLRPTDAFLITLKLSVIVGFVIAFPVIFHQVWGFLKPALYERERRMVIPAMLAGLGLFVSGVWMAFLWVLPAVLRILLSERFMGTAFEAFITAGEYFRFATGMLLAFGFVFQLPLVMVLLAALRLVSPKFFARNRPVRFLDWGHGRGVRHTAGHLLDVDDDGAHHIAIRGGDTRRPYDLEASRKSK